MSWKDYLTWSDVLLLLAISVVGLLSLPRKRS